MIFLNEKNKKIKYKNITKIKTFFKKIVFKIPFDQNISS